MGSLTLPTAGLVYIDTVTLIYTVERYPAYWALLRPLWQAAQTGTIEIVSSELTVLEALVDPLKNGDATMQQAFEQALFGTELRLLPITRPILQSAADLRAKGRLKTPDALHAATAMNAGCALVVTNDFSFRLVTGLPVVILDDLLSP